MREREPDFTPAEDVAIQKGLAGLEEDEAYQDAKFNADLHRRQRLDVLGDLLEEAWQSGNLPKDTLLTAVQSSRRPDFEAIKKRLNDAIESGFLRPEMTVREAEEIIRKTLENFRQEHGF